MAIRSVYGKYTVTGPAAGRRRVPHPYQGAIDTMKMKIEDIWMLLLVLFSVLFTLSFGWGLFG